MKVSDADIKSFTSTVWRYYAKNKRNDLGWRRDTSPYSIVVSEIMLQQTQVSRVEAFYKNWMNVYPDWESLAVAKLSEVLIHWKGLGYNRRARFLHQCAKEVIDKYDGVFPSEERDIRALPGIGVYTTAAIQAFAHNDRQVLVETNTRTAVIYHFFKNREAVSDKEISAVLKQCFKLGTKAYKNPREWNWALFDYGSHLKKTVGNLNRKSKTYSKQSRFEGSDRQIRSGIVHLLSSDGPRSQEEIIKIAATGPGRVGQQIIALEKEGMIEYENNVWRIKD